MTTITIRRHKFEISPIRDSFSRRATQITNKILLSFKRIGLSPEDDVVIPEERMPMRKAAAEVSWYIEGTHCHYSYSRMNSYAENLSVVLKVIELETQAVLDNPEQYEQFIKDFAEETDIRERRKDARKTLGLEEDCTDTSLIDAKYKKLAKEHHPDMPNGNETEFKKLNNAHKILKRELE
jgi:hypothetical protein